MTTKVATRYDHEIVIPNQAAHAGHSINNPYRVLLTSDSAPWFTGYNMYVVTTVLGMNWYQREKLNKATKHVQYEI
tara:strand:+ start:284 stop:511 length:228 start_codon:yes stop_codon:yes gene_type:complete